MSLVPELILLPVPIALNLFFDLPGPREGRLVPTSAFVKVPRLDGVGVKTSADSSSSVY